MSNISVKKIVQFFSKWKQNAFKIPTKLIFFITGILSVIWILLRVIPKPQRATYPCVKASMPIASAFILYVVGLVTSIFAFKKAFRKLIDAKYIAAIFFVALSITEITVSVVNNQNSAAAIDTAIRDYEDPLGPNMPIGVAKGKFPGRVVWVHEPGATNENCIPDKWGDGYFLDKNCDQKAVDEMLKQAILSITGDSIEQQAWDTIFHYFNLAHSKEDIGYNSDETIFIKYNAVHAWSVDNNLAIINDDSYGNVDTSPQIILALLKQLIEEAGVPQENIFIGDPFTNIFKHCYDKWSAVYPNVNYISKYSSNGGRYVINEATNGTIYYSDKGTVLDTEKHDFYDAQINADYILNIPAIKGHRWGGVTFFAKNFFGCNTEGSSWRLHAGLHRTDYDEPLRDAYNQYRVMVDLMAHEHLGGKSLLYVGDLLWGTSYEHDPPVKFQTEPFNNDWTSSILVSLDPVAIASVSLDILQKEFTVEDLTTNPPRYTYVRFGAVDDYLHQAASSEWWPDGITYDPENDGTPIGSLGVHEHWNNTTDMQYTRNLGTGEGIELVRIEGVEYPVSIQSNSSSNLLKVYPSLAENYITIEIANNQANMTKIQIINEAGQIVKNVAFTGKMNTLDVSGLNKGIYIVRTTNKSVIETAKFVKL